MNRVLPLGTPLAMLLQLLLALGCGTTRSTDTSRAATEMLLISHSIDTAVAQLDFSHLAARKVYLDPAPLKTVTDKDYLISSLRQHLAAYGCLLQEDRNKAEIIVEARSGGVGTDRFELMFGVPQMSLPIVLVPGQPSSIPEIALAKKTDQVGMAKIALFAYHRESGQAVWQSGVIKGISDSKDTWVLGAGPFRRGSIQESPSLAGQTIPLPSIPLPLSMGGTHPSDEELMVTPTSPAYWVEPPPGTPPGQTAGPIRVPSSEVTGDGRLRLDQRNQAMELVPVSFPELEDPPATAQQETPSPTQNAG